jgi:hypothetical protein
VLVVQYTAHYGDIETHEGSARAAWHARRRSSTQAQRLGTGMARGMTRGCDHSVCEGLSSMPTARVWQVVGLAVGLGVGYARYAMCNCQRRAETERVEVSPHALM